MLMFRNGKQNHRNRRMMLTRGLRNNSTVLIKKEGSTTRISIFANWTWHHDISADDGTRTDQHLKIYKALEAYRCHARHCRQDIWHQIWLAYQALWYWCQLVDCQDKPSQASHCAVSQKSQAFWFLDSIFQEADTSHLVFEKSPAPAHSSAFLKNRPIHWASLRRQSPKFVPQKDHRVNGMKAIRFSQV